jgi:hypothetical protein
MAAQSTFRYKDYELDCRPHKLSKGSWGARCRITAMDGHTPVWQRSHYVLGYFDKKKQAIAFARRYAESWIEEAAPCPHEVEATLE